MLLADSPVRGMGAGCGEGVGIKKRILITDILFRQRRRVREGSRSRARVYVCVKGLRG